MSKLPPGWDRTTLGDVLTVTYGKGLSARDRDSSGSVPVIGSAGVAGTHSSALVEGPVIVIGRKGNAGAVWPIDGPSWPIDTTYYVRCPAGVNQRFLAYQLDYLRLGELDSSTAIPSLRRQDLEAAPIALPPTAEQDRIVAAVEEHLSRLDAAEHSLRSARTRLATFRSATTSEALKGDWPVAPLSTHTVDQRYGSSAKASRTGDVPVLRMGNIVDGHLDFGDLKYLPADHPDLETCDLTLGDLLFNRTNSPELVGKSAVFTGHPTEVTFASYLIRVRLDEELDPHWAATVINSPIGRRYIDTVRTQQVGQANVNGTKLKDFPIPIPPIQVQRDRLAQLQLARGWLESVESEISRALMRAAGLRRSILTAAFSGQLVPQDPEDEPASVLLEHIRAEREAAALTKRTRKAKAS